MRISQLFFVSALLIGCDASLNYSNKTATSYVDDTKMTVKTSIANESTTFECIESQSGACFFKVSSQRCNQEGSDTECVIVSLDNFELMPGDTKKFIGVNNEESFLHCASAFKFQADDDCEPS